MRLGVAILCASQAAGDCTPSGGQYECHTTPADKDVTIFDVSALYHANPVRVCDYNALSAAECYGTGPIRRNFTLKVPQGACVPMPGILCYEVQNDGESLESIAYATDSIFRSVDQITHFNKHTLWGQKKLFRGMQLRLPNPPCVPELGNPDAPLICHTVKEGENLTTISAFYETDHATVQKLNSERLGPHPHNTRVAPGMQLQVPHPHPKPDHSKPCVADKWGKFWGCYHVPDHSNRSAADTDDDPGEPISKGQDIYEIAQITHSDPWKICELNPWIDCSPAFDCTSDTKPRSKCFVIVPPTNSKQGKPLHVASTECTTPEDNSYSCAMVPFNTASDNNVGMPECEWGSNTCEPIENGCCSSAPNSLRTQAKGLHTRGPPGNAFDYSTGKGSNIAMAWYQSYMNLNAHALAKLQTNGGGIGPHGGGSRSGQWPCLTRNSDSTALVSIYKCMWYPGMYVKIPNLHACTHADPNACYTITEDDAKAIEAQSKCKKGDYKDCKWDGANAMAGLYFGTYFGAGFFEASKVPDCPYMRTQSGTGSLIHYCTALVPENEVVTFNFNSSLSDFLVGLQFKIPAPQMIPAGSPGDRMVCPPTGTPSRTGAPTTGILCKGCTSPTAKGVAGCAAVPDTSQALNECEDEPGKHWCYRMQTWQHDDFSKIGGRWSGDYLWNVSQNVPSTPLQCSVVPSTGTPIDCVLCGKGVYNCNNVAPLTAVEIPISRPTPPHQCDPAASGGCTVCPACCNAYVPAEKCDDCAKQQCP